MNILDLIFHLNTYLALFVSQYGAWVYALLFAIIFCETGVVFMALLPGDSLLFAAGSIAATGAMNVYYLMILLVTAAFVGNVINYFVGHKLGYLLFKNEKSKIFKKSHLDKTHAFYEKHGGKTIIIACFVPIIRTFAAFVAGMSDMTHVKFIVFTFVGAILWVVGLLALSYWFGNIPIVKNNFFIVIMAIIVISVLPPAIEWIRHRRK